MYYAWSSIWNKTRPASAPDNEKGNKHKIIDLDDLRRAFADGVQQRLLDALETDLLHEQFDHLHALRVDGEMERGPAHIVDAVDVKRNVGVVHRLADDRNISERGGVEEDPLLVRQLFRRTWQQQACTCIQPSCNMTSYR